MQWVGVAAMTDMIAQDLQDIAEHPIRSLAALVLTLIILLACPFSCVATVVLLLGR